MEYLTTGTVSLDKALGGGLPWGRIVNIIGDKSSGKSALSCEIVAQGHRTLGNRLRKKYNDAERGVNFNTQLMYGFDIIEDDDEPSQTVEEFETDLQHELRNTNKDEYLIYVCDSFDSLSCKAEMDRGEDIIKKVGAGTYTGKKDGYQLEKQAYFNDFFRRCRLEVKNRNCLLIFVSQVRENIGVMFGKRYRRTGGKALDFYSSIMIWLSETEKYEAPNGLCTGISVKAFVEKNKVGLPYRTCYFNIMFNAGIDPVTSNILYLYDLKTDMGKTKTTIRKVTKKNPETGIKEVIEEGTLDWDGGKYDLDGLVKKIERDCLEGELAARTAAKWDEMERQASYVEGMGRKPRDFTPPQPEKEECRKNARKQSA